MRPLVVSGRPSLAVIATVSRRTAVCLVSAAALVACGGGERERLAAAFGGSIPRCADFQFQEDAQAAFNSGLRFLDGDNDGVACEGRPRRSSATPAAPSPSQATQPTVLATLVASDGATYVLKRSSDRQLTVDWETHGAGTGAAASEAASVQQLDATTAEVAGTTVRLRWSLAAQNALVGWARSSATAPSATGLGAAGPGASTLADLAGRYRALGQQCTLGGTSCEPFDAALTIGADAMLTVCPGVEPAESCENGERRPLAPSPLDKGVWRIGGVAENLIAHSGTGSIALTYRSAAAMVSLHGYKETFTSTAAPQTPSVGFDQDGQASLAIATFAAGDIVLASTAGQVVAWLQGRGPLHRATP